MAREEVLRNYPKASIDPFLDDSFAKSLGKRGFFNYDPKEIKINNQTIVYFPQEIESNKIIDTPLGPKRVYEHGVVICGYRINPKGLFRGLKRPKIRVVPDEERKIIESKLLEKLRKNPKFVKPAFVDFWFNISTNF